MKRLSLLLAAFAFAGVSCERHEFEGPNGTKQLHEHHGSSHGDHAADHGDHGADAKHDEKAAH